MLNTAGCKGLLNKKVAVENKFDNKLSIIVQVKQVTKQLSVREHTK